MFSVQARLRPMSPWRRWLTPYSGVNGAPGPNIASFLEEFLAGAREIEGMPQDEPWQGEVDVSNDGLRIGMGVATPHEVAEMVMTLAEKHELFAFDPQTGIVLTGPSDLYSDNSTDDTPGVGTVVVVVASLLVLLGAGGYWLFF